MKRIVKYSDMIGQTFQKNVVLNKLALNNLPRYLLFVGETGTGKSTLAELLAMSLGCQNNKPAKGQACLECSNCKENLKALESTGKSSTMVKINMPEFTKKGEAKDLVHGIFKLQTSTLHHTTYILEEFDGSCVKDDVQLLFLEEISRIQEGVTVIICTMNEYGLIPALISRSEITLRFSKISRDECKILINKKCSELGISLSSMDIEFLINATKGNVRDISNVLTNLNDLPNFSSVLREYFNILDNKIYSAYFQQCTADFYSFIGWLDDRSANVDLIKFWNGMQDFIRNCIFYLSGKGGTLFTASEKALVSKTLGKYNEDIQQSLLKYSHYKVKSVSDAEFRLIQMRSIVRPAMTINQHFIEAQKENRVADTNASVQSEIESQAEGTKKEVKKITATFLDNLSGNSKVYEE